MAKITRITCDRCGLDVASEADLTTIDYMSSGTDGSEPWNHSKQICKSCVEKFHAIKTKFAESSTFPRQHCPKCCAKID